MSKSTLFIALFSLGFALPALAYGPCKSDVEKFCKDVQPGEGRIVKCLKDHANDLSAECKARREKTKEHFKEAKAACHDDVEQFCADVEKGKGRIIKCLKEHKEQLSDACKGHLK